MTRGNARELAVHLIYGREFTGDTPDQVISTRLDEEYYKNLALENEVYTERPTNRQIHYLQQVVSGVAENLDMLNETIGKYAIGWDVKRISRLARAIMQLAIYEILFVDDVPDGVAVSEAVRLAKKYDSDAGSFVNGILGSFVRSKNNPAPAEEAEEAVTAEEPAAAEEAVTAEEPEAAEEPAEEAETVVSEPAAEEV